MAEHLEYFVIVNAIQMVGATACDGGPYRYAPDPATEPPPSLDSRTTSQSFGCIAMPFGSRYASRICVIALCSASDTESVPFACVRMFVVFRMPRRFSPEPSPFTI